MVWYTRILETIKSRRDPFYLPLKTETDVLDEQKMYAPGTRIMYDTQLVPRLKQDHVGLLKIFTDMVQATSNKDITRIKKHMAAFLALFNEHALSEYTKLYIFLDYAYRPFKDNHDLIMTFRREMNEIGREVRKFYYHWMDGGNLNIANLPVFLDQAEKIGKVLVKRIKVEEERLYEIYDMAPGLLYATDKESGDKPGF
jgi:hypothetical protein